MERNEIEKVKYFTKMFSKQFPNLTFTHNKNSTFAVYVEGSHNELLELRGYISLLIPSSVCTATRALRLDNGNNDDLVVYCFGGRSLHLDAEILYDVIYGDNDE